MIPCSAAGFQSQAMTISRRYSCRNDGALPSHVGVADGTLLLITLATASSRRRHQMEVLRLHA